MTGGSSDVSITKTRSAATIAVGSNVTYTLTPRHNGGEPPGTLAPNLITVSDTLNPALTFVSANGAGWTCGFSAPTVTCTRPGPYTGGPFTNMPVITLVAQVTAVGRHLEYGNDRGPGERSDPGEQQQQRQHHRFQYLGPSGSRRSHRAARFAVGSVFTYTLTVRNLGPVAVAGTNTITVTDTLPAGLELTATPTGTGWTCMPNAGFPLAGPGADHVYAQRAAWRQRERASHHRARPARPSCRTFLNNACVALGGSGSTDSVPGNDCSSVSVSSTSAPGRSAARIEDRQSQSGAGRRRSDVRDHGAQQLRRCGDERHRDRYAREPRDGRRLPVGCSVAGHVHAFGCHARSLGFALVQSRHAGGRRDGDGNGDRAADDCDDRQPWQRGGRGIGGHWRSGARQQSPRDRRASLPQLPMSW